MEIMLGELVLMLTIYKFGIDLGEMHVELVLNVDNLADW